MRELADTAAEKASVLGSVPLKLRYHGCTSGLPDCATEVQVSCEVSQTRSSPVNNMGA